MTLLQKYEPREEKAPSPAPLSLYVHIPFCARKCAYCDFLSAPQPEEMRERYVQCLIREIRLAGSLRAKKYDMKGPGDSSETGPEDRVKRNPEMTDTVYLGGGTPSLLTAGQLNRIMDALFSSFNIEKDAEISMEANPGTMDPEKLKDVRSLGINRLSIGIQSMHDEELRLLGRIHTAAQGAEIVRHARKAGFDNLNLDLMSGLPGQTPEMWRNTLEQAAGLMPEHISAYSLMIEPGTRFALLQETGQLPSLPREEEDREMYHETLRILAARGFMRYEISNYARPGRECRHNCGYWTGHPYLGFGVGAASYMDGVRFSNINSLEAYCDAIERAAVNRDMPAADTLLTRLRRDVHPLSREEKMEEFMFLGLRLRDGITKAEFYSRFGETIENVYGPVLAKHLRQGTLEQTPYGFRLTERGIDVSNYVLADYLTG